jgi:hypothetical protein
MDAYETQGTEARKAGKSRDANPYLSATQRGRGMGRLSAVRMRVMAGRCAAWFRGYDREDK